MIERIQHDGVVQLRLTGRVSRLLGYSASAYFTRGVLVDVGFPKVAAELSRALDELRPTGAFITHHHEDHAGNAELFATRGIPLGAGEDTIASLRTLRSIALYRWVTWGTPVPLRTRVVPFTHDALALIRSPGHSTDHHVVWDAGRETLFAGDLFLGVKVRIAHPGENPRLLVASVRAAAALRPRRMFCAHRGFVADPVAALTAKAAWLDDTIGVIDRRIADGWNDDAIRAEVLGGESASGWFSRGDYSRGNFVRAVRRSRLDPE